MKQVYINSPGKVEIKEVDIPVRKPGEALLKMVYAGICGSDISSYKGTFAYFDYPRVPGHELCAEIVEIDENERGYKPGMVVTCNPYFNCGECYSCKRGLVNACMDNQTLGCQRDGGMAEYITMPVSRLITVPQLTAKTLVAIEPFAISYHGVARAKVQQGERVLIVGAGTIGVLAGLAAKALGAEVWMCDVSQEKLDYAQKTFGFAGTILNEGADALEKATKTITGFIQFGDNQVANGFDVCIEAVGLPSTFQACVDYACFGGRVVLIGVGKQNLDFNFTIIQKKELHILGSRNATTKDFEDLMDLIVKENIDITSIVTDVYNVAETSKAFEDIRDHAGRMLKVLIEF